MLFGFSGPPNPALATRMAASLAHRCKGPVEIQGFGRHGSLGYGGSDGPPRSIPAAVDACGQARNIVIASAGVVHGERGRIDSSTLAALYHAEGLPFVKSLRGQYLLAIRDGATWHLVRDGAGARTVYYAETGGRFLFAVEPKGIWQAPGFQRRLRPGAVAQYLTFSFLPGHQTMLQGLYELPAGHTLSWDAKQGTRLARYFRFEDCAAGPRRTDEAWVGEFNHRLEIAIGRRLPAEQTSLAVFLSGGIDSSAVTAALCASTDTPVHSFAVHFGKKYPHELEFAKAVADHCNTVHEEVLIEPKHFLPRLRRMIWHLDEPIGDPITMPNFELARHVGNMFPFIFNGEGGDPCFGGPKSIPMLLHHWYGTSRGPNFREKAYLESYRRGYEELGRLLNPEFARGFDPDQELEGPLTPFFDCPHARGLLDKLTAINIRLKGAHLILPKVDRMLGAWGAQPLSPLFDEDLIRLCFEMPETLRFSRGVEKVIIKEAFRGRLPHSIIERPKSGMRVPVHYWFQGELKRFAHNLLSRENIQRAGIFAPERVQQLLNYETAQGPGRYGLRIWMLVTFELWRRLVLEGESV